MCIRDSNNTGGELVVVSRVSDKKSGDIGHPIQFDNINKHWFVNVSIEGTDNEIYPTFVGVGTTALGANTPKSFFVRKENSRSIEDSIYKFRYVIPAGITTARPPIEGYVLQETSDTTASTDAEITTTSSPPVLLIVSAVPSNASFNVLAILRSYALLPLIVK